MVIFQFLFPSLQTGRPRVILRGGLCVCACQTAGWAGNSETVQFVLARLLPRPVCPGPGVLGFQGCCVFFVCRGLGILTCMSSLNMQCSGALDPTQVNHSRTFIRPLLYARRCVQRRGDGSEWKECIQSLSSKRILFTHMYLLCAEPEDSGTHHRPSHCLKEAAFSLGIAHRSLSPCQE